MFGLMRSCTCFQTSDQKHLRRLHYCGTCKTIGRLYGQKSRFLLNSDAVFLGELLSAISKTDETLNEWHRAYQSYCCFSMPANLADMPLSLQVAATVTLFNAQFKIADQITDSKHSPWVFPQWFFSGSFHAAAKRLKFWGFPISELRECSNIQTEREVEAEDDSARQSAGEILAFLAESTGTATALVFKHGVRIVGEPAAQEEMYALGRTFGAMIYLLDALEDFYKDFRNGHFNALKAAFKLSCERLPANHRETITQTIRGLAADVESTLARLPISKTRAEQFSERLRTNLSIRLDGKRVPNRACRALPGPTISFRERFQTAMATGKSMADKYVKSERSVFNRCMSPFVFASAWFAGFLLPNHTRSATSYRECMEKASNLMLLGSALRPAISAPLYFSSISGPELPGGPDLPQSSGLKKKPEEGQSWCDGCDCCGECPCGCCSCGDCADCSC